jgi:hypothetical protein
MFNIYYSLVLVLFLSGCAAKMAYLNTQKPPEELRKDKAACQVVVDASDFKDNDLKKNKFNQCMKDKGYDVVSEEEAEKTQGFKELWIKPAEDLKAYEAVFFDEVDVSTAVVKNTGFPLGKVGQEEMNRIGAEMLQRFSRAMSAVMPVISDGEAAQGKKVLYISLKLNTVCQTDVSLSVVLEAAGELAPVPYLPDAPEGDFVFEGQVSDYASKEKFIIMSDAVKGDKNASFVGTENFSHWQKAYNIMDYWADKLAQLIAKERGQEYNSKLGWKII